IPRTKPQQTKLSRLRTNDQIARGSVFATATDAGGADVGVAPICGGGGAVTTAPSSGNCESGCQFAIPSRHPMSPAAKRPVRRPSRTSSSENTPKLVAPRLTWIMAMIGRFREMRREAQVKWLKQLQCYKANPFITVVTFLTL